MCSVTCYVQLIATITDILERGEMGKCQGKKEDNQENMSLLYKDNGSETSKNLHRSRKDNLSINQKQIFSRNG
jgi:hypothetical protein